MTEPSLGNTVKQRLRRTVLLCFLLALVGLGLPNSAPSSTEVALVRVKQSERVDAPNMIWILAIGSDARPGQSMLRTHGDALQLIGLNTRTHAATAIGIPRDSWVNVRGVGMAKINESLVRGGPQLMARSISDLVGIEPDYVLVTRFKFFEQMIDSIGGIEVRNPRAFSDPYLRPKGFKAGRIHLDGYGAMAFSRIRKSLPAGDFDRSANQQRTLRGIHAKIRANAERPGFIENGVLSVLRHTQTDLTPVEMFRLAQVVAQVDPAKITTCVIPGGVGWVGPASVVFPSVATARRYGRDARNDAVLSRC